VVEEKRRLGEAAAAEADIFGLLVRVVIAVSSCFSHLIFLIINKSKFLRAIFSGRADTLHRLYNSEAVVLRRFAHDNRF
jgi:hypothetical protein